MTPDLTKENSLIPNNGLYYPAALGGIKRSDDFMRPIYEAFTNALEAIRDTNREDDNGKISITLFSTKSLTDEMSFDKVVVEDDGIGFNDANFCRLLMFKDTRKGYLNKGSGRVQLIHFFNKCEFASTFQDGGQFKTRTFVLSKSTAYLDQNSIVFYQNTADSQSDRTGTKLTLKELIGGDKESYDLLTATEIKEKVLEHYLVYFCSNKSRLPKINIEHYDQNGMVQGEEIVADDIPDFDKQEPVKLRYSKFAGDSNEIVKSEKEEEFLLRALKLHKNKLKRNGVRLLSKDEIVENPKVKLECISVEDNIDNNRYMFLLAGSYLDSRESDTRGEIEIFTAAEFIKNRNMYSGEEILLDDVQDTVNSRALAMYGEIKGKVADHQQDIEKLKEMFLLNENTLEKMSFSLNDSEEKILAKVYSAESEIVAKKDAEIKQRIDKLDELDPNSDDYDKTFKEAIDDLVRQIPLSNRTALTHYVARRKLVLEVFQKILNKQLLVQNSKNRNVDEALLHNLIFQQRSNRADQSDLWLVNEDFVYFSGRSEQTLGEIQIDGAKLLKETLTDEETAYCTSLGQDRRAKRPDILLFPTEGKCIIIEFKSPNVSISKHLNQINRYASLIRNLSKTEFAFDTFYGYLIGEMIDGDDVRDFDARFTHSHHFDYMFRPATPIAGRFGRLDGSVYMEVIKYSTLLERASKRNEIFLDKILRSGLE